MNLLLSIPLRAPRATLAVLATITLFFGVFAAFIRVDSAIENLLPTDDPKKEEETPKAGKASRIETGKMDKIPEVSLDDGAL